MTNCELKSVSLGGKRRSVSRPRSRKLTKAQRLEALQYMARHPKSIIDVGFGKWKSPIHPSTYALRWTATDLEQYRAFQAKHRSRSRSKSRH